MRTRFPFLLPLGLALLFACPAPIKQEAPEAAPPSIAESCLNDLAGRLKVDPGLVELISSTAVDWPDTALGLTRPGEAVAQVLTPGHRLVFGAKPQGREYLYTAGEKAFRYGGPLDLWAASALALERDEADPDLNGRLAQFSLIGTNREVLLEGVGDFYPQDDGSLFVKRRTSRSGHVLLYAAPGKTSQATVVASSFDFVDAVVSPDQKLGAAVARTGPELAWELILVPLPPARADLRRVILPEGLRPEVLRWRSDEGNGAERASSGEGQLLVLIGSRDGKRVRYGLAGLDASPHWDGLPSYVASDDWDFVLSKSHSLSVYETELEGGPAVRVEYVWWNRPPEEIATIRGLKLDDFQWASGRGFVFITGRRDGGHAAMTVDIHSGEVLTAVTGARDPVKLFKAPPYAWLRVGKIAREALRFGMSTSTGQEFGAVSAQAKEYAPGKI